VFNSLRRLHFFQDGYWSQAANNVNRGESPVTNLEATQTQPGGGAAAPEISIIIVNWKSSDYVKNCLQSVYRFTKGLTFEVIVVDSASYDGCGEMLAREFSSALFIQSTENVGFAGANNLGAQRARGRDLLLLNPDTELRENSLRVLADRLLSCSEAGAVGCRLINEDGSLQTSCVQAFPTVLNQILDSNLFRNWFPRWRIWGTAPLRSAQPLAAEAVSGACILIKREVFDRVGGFSSHYFMYGEDLDLCYKIRLAGYRVYHVPETTIVHFGGGSTRQSASDFSSVMMRESVYRFLRHNRGKFSAMSYKAAMACASVMRMILILPFLLSPRGRGAQPGLSLHKWFSIFRWSLGLEPLTRTSS
jgi:GT2 family glycosyltransferase